MTPFSQRPGTLPAWALGLCAAAVAGITAAATPAGALADEVAKGVHLLTGRFVPGSQPDGNTVILEAPEGLVVIDTGRHRAHVQAIVDFATARKAPVVAVVNTHWHLDHIGGNPRIRAVYPGARILASNALEGAMKGFLADYRAYLDGAVAAAKDDSTAQAPLRAELAILNAGPSLAPDEVIERSGERRIAGRALTVGLARRAVTAGDVWLFDADTRTLVAGDLVTLPVPFLDTACPSGWQAALAALAAVDFEVLIPGHGPPLDRAQFESYRRALDALLACAASDAARDACIDAFLGEAGALVADGDKAFARELLAYYIDRVLRADPAPAARFCAE